MVISSHSGSGFGRQSISRARTALLCGTALGCVFVAAAASPGQAKASDECGPNSGAPITCPAGDYPNGVTYTGNAPISLVVDGVDTTAADTPGVNISGGQGKVFLTASNITTSGDGSVGVKISTTSGDVSVEATGVSTTGDWSLDTGASAEGILVETDTGAIHIVADDVSVSGLYSSNIVGVTRTGDVVIDAGSLNFSAPGGVAIHGASSEAGTVAISVDELTLSADASGGASQGISADGADGATIIVGTVLDTTGASGGLNALSVNGDVSITADRVETGRLAINGASNAGAVDIVAGSVRTSKDLSRGIRAIGWTGASVEAGTVVTQGQGSIGVDALSYVGDVLVDVDSVETHGDNAAGVLAQTISGGDAHVVVGSATTHGAYSDGVFVNSGDGDAVVTVDSAEAFGDASAGVRVWTVAGDIDLTVKAATTHGDTLFASEADPGTFSEAISTYTDSGDITIRAGHTTVSGLYASGVAAESQTGNIHIVSEQVDSTAEGAAAIGAYTYSGGDVFIESGKVTALAAGVQVTSAGAIAIDSGSVDITGALRATAIYAVGAGTGDIDIVSGSVTNSGAGRGVYASGAGDVSIESGSVVLKGTDLQYDGAGVLYRSDAIDAIANTGGAVTVVADAVSTARDASRGVRAVSVGGDVSVSAGEIGTAGRDSAGAWIETHGGDATAEIGSATTHGAYSDGVFVNSGDGDAVVTVDSAEAFGDASAGVRVWTVAGDIDLTVKAATTHGDTLFASEADPGTFSEAISTYTDSGDITIRAGHTTVSGLYASGVAAESQTGNIHIVSEQVDSTAEGAAAVAAYTYVGGDILIESGKVTAVSAGVQAVGAADIAIRSGTVDIVGEGRAMGVFAQTPDGSIDIVSQTIRNSTAGGRGVYAESGGALAIQSESIVTTGQSTIAPATGLTLGAEGVRALAAGPVSIRSGAISTTGDYATAIVATSNGGDVDIVSGDIVTAGASAHGVSVVAAGDARISTGDILATGADANGLQVKASNLTLNVTGDVISEQGYGAYVDVQGAATINLAAGTSIQGGNVGLYLNSTGASTINILGEIVGLNGQALRVEGAPVTINNNSNTIIGGIELTDGDDTFNNNGTWRPAGVTDFGDGNDVVVNNGLFEAKSGSVSILGLETFQNEGRMDLRNGQLGDTVDLGGAAYIGGANAQLLVDVDFATGQSDTLAVGSATGTTQIVVNNISTQQGFSSGLKFIDSAEPLSGDEFVLDPASIEDGFIDYDLEFDPKTNSFIVKALPSSDSVSMLRAGAAAQDYASKSGEAWSGRMEDLRDSDFAGVGRSRPTEVWGQMLFGARDMDQVGDFDLMGTVSTRDISADTRWYGGQVGVDHQMGGLVLGFTAGLMKYEMDFTADENGFELDGYNVGVYGSWATGGLRLSALAKVDSFDATANLRELGAQADFDGSSYDFQGEASYRFGSEGLFVEPVVGADWIKVDLDGFSAAGATADFDKLTSLKVRAGGRIGGVWRSGPYTFVPSVGAYAIDERKGENQMDFALGASGYTVTDQPFDSRGRADLGLTMTGPQGFNAWVKGEFDFGDGVSGQTLRLGFRVSW